MSALRDRIDRVESYDGDGTELVSVAVPPEKSIASVRERIAREHASAANIRSDRTRDRVRRALDRVGRILRRYESTPDHGLVVYAGVVDGDLVAEAFDDLPAPVASSAYRCDDHFHVDPLVEAARPGDSHGLVVVERGGAAVGRLVGDRVVPERTVESRVMGKHAAGGQSARRFQRDRERQVREFYGEVGRVANEALLGEDPVAGLAVGGTLATAEAFVDGDYLDYRLRERLLGTYPVEYAGERGLHRLVDRARDDLLDAERRAVREALSSFFAALGGDDPVAYGPEDVRRAATFGAVDTALLSTDLQSEEREALEAAVEDQGGDCLLAPAESDRGARLADNFGGVGALLRFPVA